MSFELLHSQVQKLRELKRADLVTLAHESVPHTAADVRKWLVDRSVNHVVVQDDVKTIASIADAALLKAIAKTVNIAVIDALQAAVVADSKSFVANSSPVSAAPHKHVVLTQLDAIRKSGIEFSGKRGESVEVFLDRIESFASSYLQVDSKHADFPVLLRAALHGSADTRMQSVESNNLMSELRSVYRSRTLPEALGELRSLRMLSSVTGYASTFSSLIRECAYHGILHADKHAVALFVQGLQPDLAAELWKTVPATVDAAIARASELEAIFKPMQTAAVASPWQTVRTGKQRRSNQRSTSAPPDPSKICRNFQFGGCKTSSCPRTHFAVCTKFNDGHCDRGDSCSFPHIKLPGWQRRRGHKPHSRDNASGSVQLAQASAPVQLSRASGSVRMAHATALHAVSEHLFKTITVNGCSVRALIDTGASINLMSQSAVARLQLTSVPDRLVIDVVGGSVTAHASTTVRLNDTPVKFYVLNRITATTAALLCPATLAALGLSFPNVSALTADAEIPCPPAPSPGQTQDNKARKPPLPWLETVTKARDYARDNGVALDSVPQVQSFLQDVLDQLRTSTPGPSFLPPLKLELKDGAKPFRAKPRRFSPSDTAAIAKEVDDFLSTDRIRPSKSPWRFNCVVISKKGKARTAINYRPLSARLHFDAYPMPSTQSVLDVIANSKFLTEIDLRRAYHQMRMTPESIPITAFTALNALYEFTVVPYGISVAPPGFCRAVADLFKTLDFVITFVDNIFIASPDLEHHYWHVLMVLYIMFLYNLTPNPDETHFVQTRASVLGMTVDLNSKSVEPKPETLQDVQSAPNPTSVTMVRSFLGLAGVVRRFVPDFAHLCAPLNALLRKDVPWRWTQVEQDAFNAIKEAILAHTQLALYDANQPVDLFTDASELGTGGVLIQNDRPLAYTSKVFSPAQSNYSVHDKEALAIVLALEAFRWCISSHVRIHTDHRNLTYMEKSEKPIVQRWLNRMSAFDYSIQFVSGVDNPSDYLSRLQYDRAVVTVADTDQLLAPPFSWHEIRDAQVAAGPSFARRYTALPEHRNVRCATDVHGNLLPVIPDNIKLAFIQRVHDINHAGHRRTARNAQKIAFIPGAQKAAKTVRDNCQHCLTHAPNNKPFGDPPAAIFSARPLERLQIDHVGPRPTDDSDRKYLLVLVDHFSYFMYAEFVSSTATDDVINVLKRFFALFGKPSIVQSDNASVFRASRLEEFLSSMDIQIQHSAPFTPRVQGTVESANKLLKRLLLAHNDDLLAALHAHNFSSMAAYSATPAQVMFRVASPNFSTTPLLNHDDPIITQRRTEQVASKVFWDASADSKLPAVGDSVYFKAGESAKSFDGPVSVIAVQPHLVVVRDKRNRLRHVHPRFVKPLPQQHRQLEEAEDPQPAADDAKQAIDAAAAADEDDEEYVPERIIKHKRFNGTTKFLTKWIGFPDDDNNNTWQTVGELGSYAADLLDTYFGSS